MLVTIIVAKEVPLSSLRGEGEEKHITNFLDIFKTIKKNCLVRCRKFFWSQLLLGCHGFHLSNTTPIGWAVKYTMGIQRVLKLKSMPLIGGSSRCIWFAVKFSKYIQGKNTNKLHKCWHPHLIEPLCRKFTPWLVWAASNFMVCIAMAGMTIISAWSLHKYNARVDQIVGADGQIRAVALVLFTALGLPLAVLFSVPFAVTATLAANLGGGQGLCTGVLNILIVVPQVIVALGSGPWDQLFGKGNTPAFALASAFAFVCGFLGLFTLPKLPRSNFRTSGIGGMH